MEDHDPSNLAEVSEKHMTAQQVSELESVPVSQIRPYIPLPAAAFVHLKRNGKLICIKPRYQVFSREELLKLAPYGKIYFLESLADIRVASLRALRLRKWLQKVNHAPKPIPNYIISDEIIRKTAPLWKSTLHGTTMKMPLLITFCCELLGVGLPEDAVKMENQDLKDFERFIARSSAAVLIAIALGVTSLEELCSVRNAFFGRDVLIPGLESISEMVGRLESPIPMWLDPELFLSSDDPVFEKFNQRLRRRWSSPELGSAA